MLASNAISRRRTRISVPQCRIPPAHLPGAHHWQPNQRPTGREIPASDANTKSAHVSCPLSCPSGTTRNTPVPPLPAGQAP